MRKVLINSQGKALLYDSKFLAVQDGLLPTGYRRLTGIQFDGNVWYNTGLYLHGSDTLRFSFAATKGCNVLGCYSTASADDNYSLYVSTSSSARYLRYNGGTYNSYIAANTRYDVVITPTGSDGMRVDSAWEEKTFTTSTTLLIGSTSVGATSAKMTGPMYGDIVIDGVAHIIAAESPLGEIGYYILEEERFIENLGTGTPVALGYAN